ncbi:hypothetical protein [Streptomyces cinnamoneus]|uniref:Kazal-like domain-containing protein n=1 Tax=Streptomyces cinnamoneus TaxID=53446 RepID=A0A918WL78_STRCJ|nr:hypothetical protein [Streptomyces cinnamoneus]GHC53184.1 hypothetical protein GCM10010507_31670 [Streptomyces cinnamoneus]
MRKLVVPFASVLLAGAAGLTFSAPAGAAQAAGQVPVTQECGRFCPANYDPVFCRFSDGSTGRFTNQCFAVVHACQRGLTILSCHRVPGTA